MRKSAGADLMATVGHLTLKISIVKTGRQHPLLLFYTTAAQGSGTFPLLNTDREQETLS